MPIQGYLDNLYKGTIEEEDGVFTGRGLGAAILKPFVKEEDIESKLQQQDVKETLLKGRYNPADFNLEGMTRYDALGEIISRDKAKKEKELKKEREYQLLPLQMQMEENRAARRDQMMMNADNLALQRDRLMLEDQRYNERLDREERNRRQESIMAMMSGLASLGAAFAM